MTPADWTLVATSAAHARDRAAHPAIVCEGRVLDYARLHRESNRLAHRLVAAGAGVGTRVGYLGRESEYYYLAVLACAKAGAVLVPVNWRLTAGEIDHILRDSDAQVVLVDEEFGAAVDRLRPELPRLRTVVRTGLPGDHDPGAGLRAWSSGAPDGDLAPGTGPDDPVVQIYTSGTTGRPKGAVVPHRGFFTLPAAQRAAGVDWLDWRPEDVSLISLPGLGTAGIGWFMHGFNAGLTNVVMRMFLAQDAVRLIREHRVTTTFAAPSMLSMMLDERGADRSAFRSLRKIAYGGAPISESLLTRCIDVFGCEFAQIYASTETVSVAACLPPADHRPGSGLLRSAGRACPGNELKVIDGRGRRLGPGEIGQVCVKAPSTMLGYWNLPEATRAALVDGWMLMGDAGYLDERGYLFLCDRINDTVIVAGQNIYPAEVERALGEHPSVADSAVVGLPHPVWGEAVHACVVPRDGERPAARDLLLFLRDRIADYKIPVAFHFADSLPRNPAGKILRRTVRERLGGAAAPAAAAAARPGTDPLDD
ncbi:MULTISPECIES: long-chain-fatty-acid--CoA ligase [Streptomyces]|uniref:long-chain-fatty-acid--CoA ligase n=1 Tax=Streptomyces TaxID=1883 RepID=UPI000F7AF3F0|nr:MULTISPECIES: long-chain-fatty-acid--CoA ligase [Streptomyces]RST06967.1 long-chain-fatty-acid--CoA ligase [Streptomyces sp. WAC07149]GLX17160.1 acyl-CoA synthetase [Streptomyces lavendulae subsp. lavendulae]GLX29668.1 acyl-CoA synthetase [Streptomyces lavendulae subsp. lavendulae]